MSDIWAEFTPAPPRQPASAPADPWAEFTPVAPPRENTVTVRPAGRAVAMPSYDASGNATGMQEDVAVDVAAPSRMRDQIDDIVKSAGGGLVRGVSGLLGLPEAASSVLVKTADRITQKLTGESDADFTKRIADRQASVMFPGASEAISPAGIQRGIETVTGPAYKPQTTAGEYVSTAAEFVPGGAVGKLPNVMRNAIAFGVVPGLTSEAAGQAAKGTQLEQPLRLAGALGGSVGAAMATRAGTAGRLLQTHMEGVTPSQIEAAERLMEEAGRQNIALSRAEAIQSVTNGATKIGDLQHTVEGMGGLKQFYAQRPAQNAAAARQAFDTIAPASPDPSQIGPQAAQTAESIVERVRGAINDHTRPMYQAAAGNMVPDSVHAAMIADPLFDQALRTVRNDPARNSFVRGQSDRSIATYDAVAKELEERARGAAQPLNPNASQAVTSATGTLGSDVKDIAMAADRAATNGPSAYEAALANQTRLRDEYLNPLLNGPIGKLAGQKETKRAIDILFPANPVPNSADEVSSAVRALSNRAPVVARDLVRAHAEGVFNEASQRLASAGPNQAGGARFAATLRGNSQQAENLEAAVRALPNGDQVWPGFNRLLDVMEAQQFRQGIGSRTAFKSPAVNELKNGGVVNNVGQAIGTGGFKIPAKVQNAIQNWNVGRNLDQLSWLLTDLQAAARFRSLATANERTAPMMIINLVNSALSAPERRQSANGRSTATSVAETAR